MGDWRLIIHGVGAHHNQQNPTDADLLARAYVDTLQQAGHMIRAARFEYSGGYEDLVSGDLAMPNPSATEPERQG